MFHGWFDGLARFSHGLTAMHDFLENLLGAKVADTIIQVGLKLLLALLVLLIGLWLIERLVNLVQRALQRGSVDVTLIGFLRKVVYALLIAVLAAIVLNKDDVGAAMAEIRKLFEADERILADPAPGVWASELSESSVDRIMRAWAKSSDFWVTKADLLRAIKDHFAQTGVSILLPQRQLTVVEGKLPAASAKES